MKKRSLTAAIAAISLALIVGPFGVGVASASTRTCDGAYSCNHYPIEGYFYGGNLSIDFDGAGNVQYTVRLFINDSLACTLPPIYGNDAPGSWTCYGMPAGSVRVNSSSYPNQAWHQIGTRYYQ